MMLCGNLNKIFVRVIIAMEMCKHISIVAQDPSLPAGERDGHSGGQGERP